MWTAPKAARRVIRRIGGLEICDVGYQEIQHVIRRIGGLEIFGTTNSNSLQVIRRIGGLETARPTD